MACETNTWLVMFFVFLAVNCMQCVLGVSQVPCLFIFGDSMSDSGNNNELPTTTKSNYRPYGVDFPFGPTGRFTDGRTEIDIISNISLYLSRPLIFLIFSLNYLAFSFALKGFKFKSRYLVGIHYLLFTQRFLNSAERIKTMFIYRANSLFSYPIHFDEAHTIRVYICSSVSGI